MNSKLAGLHTRNSGSLPVCLLSDRIFILNFGNFFFFAVVVVAALVSVLNREFCLHVGSSYEGPVACTEVLHNMLRDLS